jgi:hypothetical protein
VQQHGGDKHNIRLSFSHLSNAQEASLVGWNTS